MPNIVKPSGINQLWAAGGTKVDPGLQKLNIGWVVELPPYQYQNWLDNRQDTFIAHINQHGIPEWDSETEYQGNLSYTQGSNGMIYKCIQTNTNRNPTNPVNNTYWSLAFEVYGSVSVVQNALNAHIANYQTLTGLTNLAAARSNLDVFSKSESDNRFAALLGNPSNQFRVANATLATHAVPLGQLNSLLSAATESATGVIQIATVGEVEAGVDNTKAITPAKGQAVYLKKSQNLNDLPNKAIARSNLGLADSATLPSSTFLQATNNLSDLTNVTVARNNLGLGTAATSATGDFLRTTQNFADVPNKPLARTNLGLTDLATTSSSDVLFKAQNLAGLANVATARANLGLADSATLPSSTWLRTSNNLSDVPNKQAARNNLGLGGASTKDVFGVSGDLDYTASLAVNGYQKFPSGLIHQWGTASVPLDGNLTINFPIPFPNVCFGGQVTFGQSDAELASGEDSYAAFTILSTSQARLTNGYKRVRVMHWFAYGR